MKRISHIGITACGVVALGADPVGLGGALFGAVLPDADLKVGLPHRTWTHWWAFYVGVLLFLTVYPHTLRPVALDFVTWACIGALFHIIEDSCTVGGVPFWFPIPASGGGFPFTGSLLPGVSQRFSFGITKTGGLFEYLVLFSAVLLLLYFFPDRIHSFFSEKLQHIITLFRK